MKPEDVDQLVRQLEERRAFFQMILKNINAAKKGSAWDPVALSSTLRAAVDSPHLENNLRATLARVQQVADQAASVAVLELESDIRDLCQSRGWRVDGQWPTLIIERAIELKVDSDERTVKIAGRKTAGTSTSVIERALEERVTELIPRGFDPTKFIAQLAQAYDSASGGKGGEITVLHVYRALVILSQPARFWRDARRAGFSELTNEQFRARLSAALEANATAASDGRELRLLPPIEPKDAVFLYQPAENRFGFVGRIEFRKTERGNA
jgi:hypothetical protein